MTAYRWSKEPEVRKAVEEFRRRTLDLAIGRLLKRLHVRGLIRKVPRSRRWHVSPKGHRVLQGVLQIYHRGIPAALGTAA